MMGEARGEPITPLKLYQLVAKPLRLRQNILKLAAQLACQWGSTYEVGPYVHVWRTRGGHMYDGHMHMYGHRLPRGWSREGCAISDPLASWAVPATASLILFCGPDRFGLGREVRGGTVVARTAYEEWPTSSSPSCRLRTVAVGRYLHCLRLAIEYG